MSVVVPPQGTPEFEAFMGRVTRDPRGPEALVFQAAVSGAQEQYQRQVRKMLSEMIDLVPGQLFRDVEKFHEKFKLARVDDPGHMLPWDLQIFRAKFLLEELQEYLEAVDVELTVKSDGRSNLRPRSGSPVISPEKALDALIDLVYVALGTAYLHRFNFNEGWRRVQEANMAKVRTERASDSARGSTFDVIKPEGWSPPDHSDLMGFACTACGGRSMTLSLGEDCTRIHPSGLACTGKMA